MLEEHEAIIKLLIKHNVKFIIIGGYAVIYHGFARTTLDIDMWLQPDNQNRDNLIEALKEYGIIEEDLKKLKLTDFKSTIVFHIGEEPYKVKFLTKISGVEFEEADKEKVLLNLDNMSVPVINLKHLIKSKIVSERPKDRIDVEELQKINKYKKKKN